MNEDDQAIPPTERARDRRRDRDAEGAARSGMRTGLAKQFKQVLDAQRKRADEAERNLPKPGSRDAHGEPEIERRRGRTRPT